MRPCFFLDVDGVLNRHEFDDEPDVRSSGLDPDCVAIFNRIVREADAEIVLSSAWRYMVGHGAMTLGGFEYLLRTHGVAACGRLIGHTPLDEEIPTRGQQIRQWLNVHGGRPYVVLDDGGEREDGSFDDLGLSLHPWIRLASAEGLTAERGEAALALLAEGCRKWETSARCPHVPGGRLAEEGGPTGEVSDAGVEAARSLREELGNPRLWSVGVAGDGLHVRGFHASSSDMGRVAIPSEWRGYRVEAWWVGPLRLRSG